MEILELELFTRDPDGLAAFYTDALNLPVRFSSAEKTSWQIGRSVLTFVRRPDPVPVYHLAFNVLPGTIRQHFDRLAPRVPLLPNPAGGYLVDFSNWKAWSFYFSDPQGNILEYIDRAELQPEPARYGNGLVSLGEFGLVVDDALEAARSLGAAYGLAPFSRQPASLAFAALGDDRGLFILSRRGRNWFPTNIVAEPAPARVVFRDAAGERREMLIR